MKEKSANWVLGHKIIPYDTSGDYDLVLGETPAKVKGPPPHVHHSYKEVFLVVEGEMEFMHNGNNKTIRAGESVDIPPNTVHTFSNNSDTTCKWVNIHSPKGFKGFFDTIGVPVDDANSQEKSTSADMIKKVIRIAPEFDMHIKM